MSNRVQQRPRTYHGETYGNTQSPEYHSYASALARCTNVNGPKYASYGGRGIEFRFKCFAEFLAEVGRKPSPTHTLDRIDNLGHYEPGNVRWATPTEQALNRRSTVWLTLNGVTMSISQWAAHLQIKSGRIRNRKVRDGWCDECSLTAVPWQRCTHKV